LNGFITVSNIKKPFKWEANYETQQEDLSQVNSGQAKIKEETVERVIKEFVETVREEVRKGGVIEIRGLASWRKNEKGKVKVKNFIKEG